jgi:hypothetical protein
MLSSYHAPPCFTIKTSSAALPSSLVTAAYFHVRLIPRDCGSLASDALLVIRNFRPLLKSLENLSNFLSQAKTDS